ncbi:helix-turn-helix domain-containing protein [Gemmata sp. G18]|uniref:Helix-turn-helix domain-containing protein n=1 Tax=Gemmata palustris TaxID=2822762 RepID=A0ABS5BSK8_9BACT|nr:helix-turn-helix domain-containing protein [Gemmata palustris]MBP3956691.1 helix-turn-helix domain-containing protein [Gemmata palustris]
MASAEGQRPSRIAAHVGCAVGTIHNTIHTFEKEGADGSAEKTRGPKNARPVLGETKADPLKAILHQSPRGHFSGCGISRAPPGSFPGPK